MILHNIVLLQLGLHVFIMDFICFKYILVLVIDPLTGILRLVAIVFIIKTGKAVKFVFQQLSLGNYFSMIDNRMHRKKFRKLYVTGFEKRRLPRTQQQDTLFTIKR